MRVDAGWRSWLAGTAGACGTARQRREAQSMFNSSFDAVVPVICVSLAGPVRPACRGVPRAKGERMPIGGLAIIGLVGAGVASVLLWDRNATSFGVVTADNFALFVNLVLVVVGILTVFFSSQTLERDGLPAGEFYALMLFCHRRHDADGAGHRPAADVPGARDHVDCGVRADRHAPRSEQRAPKPRSSTSCSARSPARSSSTASRSSTG